MKYYNDRETAEVTRRLNAIGYPDTEELMNLMREGREVCVPIRGEEGIFHGHGMELDDEIDGLEEAGNCTVYAGVRTSGGMEWYTLNHDASLWGPCPGRLSALPAEIS